MTHFLAACRHLLIIPVIGCVFLTLGTVIMGIVRIITGGAKVFGSGDYGPKAAKTLALAVIEIIDLFLVDIALGSGVDGFEVCRRLRGGWTPQNNPF